MALRFAVRMRDALHDPREILIGVTGAYNVGKVALINSFGRSVFQPHCQTEDPEISVQKAVQVDGKEHIVRAVALFMESENKAGVDAMIRSCKAFVIVFSVTSPESLYEIDGHIGRITLYHERPRVVIAGNKNEVEQKERRVTREAGENRAKSLGAPYLECSAKTGDGVGTVFETAVRLMLRGDDVACCCLV